MKKISTLALALIAMGTVTSAWATSTDNLPTGYYKIKSAVTGNSNITNIHMFNDAFLEVNTPKATLLSSETAETNNYIWYVTNTGGSKISIVNGQGTGIKLEDGNKGSYSYKGPHKELTPVDANSTYPTSIYFSEGLYTPNTSGAQSTNHQYGSYTAAAYWANANAATTKWSFESVSVENKGVYTVTVTGSADGYVTRTATSEHAFNGGFFIAASGSTISADDLAAGTVEGYTSNVSVDASTKTITVTYTVKLSSLVEKAKDAISHTSAGYPLEGSESRTNLQEAINAASGTGDVQTQYTNLNTALEAYKSDQNVKMPEDGKVYVITNVQQDGTCYHFSYSTGSLSAVSDKSKAAQFVCRVVDGKYVFVNAEDGKYLVVAASGSSGTNSGKGYITEYDASWADLTLSKNSMFSCFNIGGRRYTDAQKQDQTQQSANFIVNKDGSFNGWNMTENNDPQYTTAFKLEEVTYPNTVTFNAVSDVEGVSNLATFSAPFATVVPTNVTAYYVSTADNSTATMKAIEAGKAIPAKTGVLLTSESADAVTMVPATGETLATITDNKLGNSAGAAKTIAEGDNAYILAKDNNGTAFYKGKVGTILGMNKAYLTLNEAGAPEAISMNFGGNVTGINQIVNAEQNNAPVYDLTGCRVVRTVKGGLYIKGGNKFIAR